MNIFVNISDSVNKIVGFVFPILPVFLLILVYFISIFREDDILDVKNEDYKYRKISYKQDKSVLISGIVILAFFLFILLVYIDARYERYINEVMENNSIDLICIISMTFTAMIFAMAFVLVLREKNYYLAFSLSDVLEKYNFYFWLKALFISCILVSLLVVTLLNGKLSSEFDIIRFIALQEVFLFNVFCMIISFWIIEQIMFSSEGKELKLLDRLYQFYMLPNVDETHMKEEWDDANAIKMNLTYLYERYLYYGKKINIRKLQKILYLSWIDNGENQKKALRRAKKRYYFWIIFFLIAWIGIFFGTNSEIQFNKKTFLQILIFASDFILPYLPFDFISKLMIKTFGNDAGYKFYGAKEQLVTEETYIPWERKYVLYIQAMNSWLAFVSIALDKKSSPENINNVLKEYTNKIGEEFKTSVGLLPFWVIGYMLFNLPDNKEQKGDADQLDYLRKLYKGLELKQEQKLDFKEIVSSQIAYIERKQKLYNGERAKKYIEWLSKK